MVAQGKRVKKKRQEDMRGKRRIVMGGSDGLGQRNQEEEDGKRGR